MKLMERPPLVVVVDVVSVVVGEVSVVEEVVAEAILVMEEVTKCLFFAVVK
jgi:hypothetical protein